MIWPIRELVALLKRIQFLSLASSLIGLQVAGPRTYLAPGGAKESNCPVKLCDRFFFFTLLLLWTLLQMLPFAPPLPTFTQPSPLFPSGHHHTIVCVHGLRILVLWLIPSPCFIQFPSLIYQFFAFEAWRLLCQMQKS